MYQRRDLGHVTLQSSNLPGRDIDVATVQLEDAKIVYEITATVNGHTETQRHAIGTSGTNPIQGAAMTPAELQGKLDGFRQAVADNAAWRAAMETAGSQVK